MKTWQKLQKNPELFEQYFIKEYVIKASRWFFEERGYRELESPILTTQLPQERYLDVLKTQIELSNDKSYEAYLIPSTERFNKIALAAGLGDHFVISKVFRGLEEVGPNHSPEFTMLEWYEVGNDYKDLMNSVEDLFLSIKKYIDNKHSKVFSPRVKYQGKEVDISSGWYRYSVREVLEKFAKVDLDEILNLNDFRNLMESREYSVSDEDDWQTMFELLMVSEIEPKFPTDKPLFLYDYPSILCPLTAVNKDDPIVSEKVEIYFLGMELGNGYTELLDPDTQKINFDKEQEARNNMGRYPIKYDEELLEAISSGIPKVAGIGIGIDRLAMIMADQKSIADINLFPISEMLD